MSHTPPSYRQGTNFRSRAIFRAAPSRGGALGNPGVVTVRARKGDGTEVDLSPLVVHDGLGEYHVDVLADVPGNWTIRWVGSGSGPNAAQLESVRVLSADL